MTVLALVLLASTAVAQNETFFSEVLEVRVTSVDVIVTGRDGKPVTDLTRDDFEIYEDGVRKDISNFLESKAKTVPSATGEVVQTPARAEEDFRRRDITIFVDHSALHPLRRNQILPILRQFVERNVRAGDALSLAIWSSSLKVDLDSATDRAAIDAAIRRLESSTTLSATDSQAKELFYRGVAVLIRAYAESPKLPGQPPPKPPWSSGIAEARTYAMRALHESQQRIEALKSVIAWRRGVEGRKILILLTSELSTNPAEEAFLHLDAMRESFEGAGSPAIMDAREFEIPSLVHEVTGVANSSGVTLYPIDAGGKDSALAARDGSSTPRFDNRNAIAQPAMMPTLRAIAAETGGVALSGSDNWKLAFDTISNDLESYYSLGYRSSGEQQDRMKNIEVKLKNKRHNVRTRRAVIEKSITSEMYDAVAANLFRASGSNDLSIRAAVGAATPGDAESVIIPLTVTIPMNKLTLVPEGMDLSGRFVVYAAFLRKDGAVSKVAQQPGAVRFPAESLKRRKELTVTIGITTDAETNGLSVGVMDVLSRATGFAAVKF